MEKKVLTKSNFVRENKVEVVGCSRLSESFSYKKITPKQKILYYAIENNRGLPNSYVEKFGNKFFKDLDDHNNYNLNYNWKILHKKTMKVLKKYALENTDVPIILKIKTGQLANAKEYLNLPKNIKIEYYGVGHKLIKDSKVIIGLNTTALLEGIASNRFILIPYFHKKNNKSMSDKELSLNLSSNNYAFSETDFYNKLVFFMKKKYNINKINNNQYSLKYHLGNADNKADLRLNKFIRKNIKNNAQVY